MYVELNMFKVKAKLNQIMSAKILKSSKGTIKLVDACDLTALSFRCGTSSTTLYLYHRQRSHFCQPESLSNIFPFD
jgi:hypothetical protein